MPAGDGTGRDFPDLVTRLAAQEGYGPAARLRAVATGLCRPDEEIAEHLRATRSPRCHTAGAGAAMVWTECGREVDPDQVDCETATCRRCGEIDRQLRHDARADVDAVGRDGDASGATRAAGPPRRPGPRQRDHADDGGAARPNRLPRSAAVCGPGPSPIAGAQPALPPGPRHLSSGLPGHGDHPRRSAGCGPAATRRPRPGSRPRCGRTERPRRG